jgi:hypothetical protein
MALSPGGFTRKVGRAVIPGGAAGAHTVPGHLAPGDTLIAVQHVSDDLVTNTDLVGEFSITAGTEGVIDNTGGTDTTGDALIVVWVKAATG